MCRLDTTGGAGPGERSRAGSIPVVPRSRKGTLQSVPLGRAQIFGVRAVPRVPTASRYERVVCRVRGGVGAGVGGEGRGVREKGMATVLQEAERWAAELSQSHIAHPLLIFYRSQHLDQSWLLSLTTLLDSCALVLVSRRGVPARQARATFRMAVRVAADLVRILGAVPDREASERLPAGDLPRLCAALESSGLNLQAGTDAEAGLTKLRGFYEPYVLALSAWLLVPLPEWIPAVDEKEDGPDLLSFADFGLS